MDFAEFVSGCRRFFLDESFEVGECGRNGFKRLSSVHYYVRTMRSGVFKGTDHFFIYVVDSSHFADKEYVEKLHETSRKFVNSRIKTPRAFRFKVPNIVSLFIADKTPDEATIEYIQNIRRPWQGGEVHNAVYIDTNQMNMYIHGTTLYSIQGLFTMKLNKIDPSNRSFHLLQKMLKYVLNNQPDQTTEV